MLKRISIKMIKITDVIASFLIIPSAYVFLMFRRRNSRLPKTSRRLQSIGVFPIMKHYYEPFVNEKMLRSSLSTDRELPGIKLNKERQIALLEKLVYSDEIKN